MASRFPGSLLPSQSCPSLSQVKQALHQNWPVFSLERFHLLRQYICPEFSRDSSIRMDTTRSILKYQLSRTIFDLWEYLEILFLLRSGLITLFYVFWFYPMQVFSLVLSNLWDNEIATLGYAAMGRTKHNITEPTSQNETQTTSSNTTLPTEKAAGLGGVVIGIGELAYSFLLLNIFFIEVYATGLIPFIGKALNFLLLSWMYAYYSFEYKWNFSEVTLDRRLDFFESNWAFFLGFGSPCTLAIFFFSRLVSYGVMATLFPLFVLTATSTDSEQEIFLQRTKWKCVGLGRLPIFYLADTISMRILSLIPLSSREAKQEHKDL